MSVTLDNSLKTFEEKVSPKIDNMVTVIKTISNKISEISSCSENTSKSLSECLQGSILNSATTCFNSIKTYADKINSSIETVPNSAITIANDLLGRIKVLNELIEQINEKEEKLNNMGGLKSIPDDDQDHTADINHNNEYNKLKDEKEELEKDYYKKEEEAKSILNSMKELDIEVEEPKEENPDAGTDFAGISLDELKNLTPGSYTEHEFTGSNGKTVKYWIYVPENIDTTKGLPVTMYMCGGGERGNRVNDNSLPLYIKNGTVKPQGIVITLRAETNDDYTDKAYLTASKELCDNVVTTFEADTNRISLSGHSNGGRGVIAMAARYPDYFSTVVPVCGYSDRVATAVDSGTTEEVINNLKTTHFVGLGGSADQSSCTSMNNLVRLLASGGNASLEVCRGYSHTTIYHKYYEPVTIDGVEYSSLLDYLFTYRKS